MPIPKAPSVNVLGGKLTPCSSAPLTGFYRNGCCDTGPDDAGSHTVCAVMTAEFLAYSKYVGNDLSTAPGIRLSGAAARRPLVPLRKPLPAGA